MFWWSRALLAIATAGALTFCQDTDPTTASPTVISVKDHRVTVEEFDALAVRLSGEVALPVGDRDEARQRVLDVFLAREALLLEGEARQLTSSPDLAAALEARERELVADYLYEREVTEYTEPTPEHLDSLYATAGEGEAVRARHILCATEEEAQATLRDLLGGADFAELAKARSQHAMSAPMGGDMGFLRREYLLPEMQDPVWQAPVGELLEAPIKTRMGYHVVEITEHRHRTFDEMRAELAGEARNALRHAREDEIGAQLRDRYRFAWHPEVAAGVIAARLTASAGADSAIATWDGGFLTVAKFIQYSRGRGRRETVIDTAEARQLGEAGALRPLLWQMGLEAGLSKTAPEIRLPLRRTRAEMMGEALFREVARRVDVTPTALRQAFESNRRNYRRPPLLHIREILLDDRQLADSLAALVRGGANMADLATRYSRRVWAAPKGGDLGEITEGMPAYSKMARVARKAPVGQVIGPVPSHGGYSIIEVLGRKEGAETPFEESRMAVVQDLRNRAMDAFIDSLKAVYRGDIEIHEAALQLTLEGTPP